MTNVTCDSSLLSKRFHLVFEQRKTKEQDSQFWPSEKWNKSQKMKGGGGEGRKETLAEKPLNFDNLRSSVNAAPDWLGLSNNNDMCQSKVCFILRGHRWYLRCILIFCGCCLFWSARFAPQCQSIFFDLFWNMKLFLRVNKDFRLFN